MVSPQWFRWFNNIYALTGSGVGITSVANGGTGTSNIPTNGQLLIGNGTDYSLSVLTAGSGVTITNTAGHIEIAGNSSAPITKTADFTVGAGETWFINNKTGSTCTVTLPTASTNTGRQLNFKNTQAQTLVSASSNVVGLAGGAAATAILAASTGDWAALVSDGTNWIIMQAAANNCLLLE